MSSTISNHPFSLYWAILNIFYYTPPASRLAINCFISFCVTIYTKVNIKELFSKDFRAKMLTHQFGDSESEDLPNHRHKQSLLDYMMIIQYLPYESNPKWSFYIFILKHTSYTRPNFKVKGGYKKRSFLVFLKFLKPLKPKNFRSNL